MKKFYERYETIRQKLNGICKYITKGVVNLGNLLERIAYNEEAELSRMGIRTTREKGYTLVHLQEPSLKKNCFPTEFAEQVSNIYKK